MTRRNNPGHRPLYEIAQDIGRTWKKPYFGAAPYIREMAQFTNLDDPGEFGGEGGRMVVNYFLANAGTWRGPDAARIKAELRGMLGLKVKKNPGKSDPFLRGYVQCALWSTNDESNESGGDPLDENYSPDDIALETRAKMVADADKFSRDNYAFIVGREEEAGHDFWLTRNGHGAGFWDGDWPEASGKRLTDAAHAFGEFNLYVGDDGQIHGTPLRSNPRKVTRKRPTKRYGIFPRTDPDWPYGGNQRIAEVDAPDARTAMLVWLKEEAELDKRQGNRHAPRRSADWVAREVGTGHIDGYNAGYVPAGGFPKPRRRKTRRTHR